MITGKESTYVDVAEKLLGWIVHAGAIFAESLLRSSISLLT